MTEKKETAHIKSIEELKADHKVSDVIFEGVKAANDWKAGKQVTDAEFIRACDDFYKAPIDGRKKKEEAKG